MSKKLKPFKGQIYSELKKKHNSTNLFVDPEFPANFKSLHHTDTFNLKHLHIEWKRPKVKILKHYIVIFEFYGYNFCLIKKDICKNPEFESKISVRNRIALI